MTSNNPLVSAITIFFNAEKFFAEAIESVLGQTYDNWELLLADDGSTDRSTEIAKKYATEYPIQVRYLEHQGHRNRGMSATRNLGIRHSKGKYIAFLDADDVWLPHKLERQVAIFECYPKAGMVYGATQYWYSWTGLPEDLERDHVPDLGVPHDTLFEPPTPLTLLYPLGEASAPCPSDLMLRYELVKRVDGFEESFTGQYQLYEDQAFLAKVYLNAAVIASGEHWTRYRIHADSCMSTVERAGQYHSVRLRFLNWLAEYFSSQGVSDSELWKALLRAMKPYCRSTEDYERVIQEQKAWIGELEKGKTWVEEQWKALQRAADERERVISQQVEQIPAIGDVQFGSFRRVKPISRSWGYDRGRPIDRYYIENFLARQAADIRGRVLEIGDNSYTCKFGGDRVTSSDVLHVAEGVPQATIVADLTSGNQIPSDSFDCIILTQTLQLIYDVRAAIRTIFRILKPGGVLLATFPGITQTYDPEWSDRWFWSFTTHSAKRLFEEVFPAPNVKVEPFGNVLAAIAFLHGLAVEELTESELDYYERGYDVTITLRVAKAQVVLPSTT